MLYSITCSTKILSLAIASFLFIFVSVLCEFAMVPGGYILLSPKKKRCTLLSEGTDAQIQQHINQKDLNFCQPLYYCAKVTVELGKAQTRYSTVLW